MINKKDLFNFHLFYNPVFRRWCYVILLTILAVIICIVAFPPLIVFARKFFSYLKPLNWIILLIIQLPLVFLALLILVRLCGYPYLIDNKISYRYPPIRAFALAGAIVFIYLYLHLFEEQAPSFPSEYYFFLWLSLYIIVVCLISYVTCEIIKQNVQKKIYSKITPDNNSAIDNNKSLQEWLNEEKPIDTTDDDKFEHDVYARRIAKILKDQNFKTISLAGPHGCGKSSIIRMINNYLINQDKQENNNLNYERIVTCEVSGWGFHEGSATDHILERAIHTLSKHIDCTGIAKLPSNYRNAISKVDFSWFKIFSDLFDDHSDPLDVLRKLDNILKCAKIRLVIFLEDIDRNTKPDTSINDYLISEIEALLDRLKILHNVSFVFTISKETDLARIAEHMEVVPDLPEFHIISVIQKFRDYSFNEYIYIDCLTKEEQNKRIGLEDYNSMSNILNNSSSDKSSFMKKIAKHNYESQDNIIIKSIARLLANPRTLKAVLRRSQQAWDSLYGEIDFDDILVANVIRFISSSTYLYINKNLSQMITLGFDRSSSDKTKPEETSIYKGLNETISNNAHKKDIHNLVNFLFPGWLKGKIDDSKVVPQGVANQKVNDYWGRLNREEIIPPETRDQDIICTMEKWNNSKEALYNELDLPNAIYTFDDIIARFDQFNRIISTDRLFDLTSKVFAISLETNGNMTNRDNTNGYSELIALLAKRNTYVMEEDKSIFENFKDWILKEIDKSLRVSLEFATDLISSFRDTLLIRNEDFNSIITLSKNIIQDPNTLIKIINPKQIKSIGNYIWNLSILKTYKFEEWAWFIDLLFKAADIQKDIIIPQIAGLISLNSQNKEQSYPDVLKMIFSNKISKAMSLLTENIDTSNLDSGSKKLVEEARSVAIKWLNDNKITGNN